MLSFKQIDYALAVEKFLHFKKAADACFISPSTLSNAISELEIKLGIQIFERTNKKVIVTSAGKEILKKAKDVKHGMFEINELARTFSSEKFQSISIGIIPTISPYLLPLVLPKVQQDLPFLDLNIEENQSNVLVRKVQEGELDLAILALPYDIGELKSIKFWSEDFYWISSKKNNKLGQSNISASQLSDKNLLLLVDGHCLKDHILEACNIDSSASYSLKASNLETLIQLVKGKMGTTLIPEMALNQLVRNKKGLYASHLSEKSPHREIAMIFRETYSGQKNINKLKVLFEKCLKNKPKYFKNS
tara:strand:+ start:525 stop:1439 length:915 start_codon:yes stop_codon:yes gene_type:complete